VYNETRNDLNTFLTIDRFLGSSVEFEELLAGLTADNWQVQQMALWALGHRGDSQAINHILNTLDAQDALDVYGSPDPWAIDGTDDVDTRETWRCRFRVKQAACHALGAIGAKHGPDILGSDAIRRLTGYATDQREDYVVRAAACQALGLCRATGAHVDNALKAAANDSEWCTATEARKALQAIG